jgi:hypothetical protein
LVAVKSPFRTYESVRVRQEGYWGICQLAAPMVLVGVGILLADRYYWRLMSVCALAVLYLLRRKLIPLSFTASMGPLSELSANKVFVVSHNISKNALKGDAQIEQVNNVSDSSVMNRFGAIRAADLFAFYWLVMGISCMESTDAVVMLLIPAVLAGVFVIKSVFPLSFSSQYLVYGAILDGVFREKNWSREWTFQFKRTEDAARARDDDTLVRVIRRRRMKSMMHTLILWMMLWMILRILALQPRCRRSG